MNEVLSSTTPPIVATKINSHLGTTTINYEVTILIEITTAIRIYGTKTVTRATLVGNHIIQGDYGAGIFQS